MQQYHLLQIYIDSSGIYFKTTDDATKKWIIESLRSQVPGVDVYEGRALFYNQLAKLKDRDLELGWGIITQLCSIGWEPFSTMDSPSASSNRSPLYFFRLRVEKSA